MRPNHKTRIAPTLTVLAFFALACLSLADDESDPSIQAHVDVEMQISARFDKYREAQSAVAEAIDRVPDPARQKLIREIFAANEKAWESLVDSEVALRKTTSRLNESENRISHFLWAERVGYRIQMLKDWLREIDRENKR